MSHDQVTPISETIHHPDGGWLGYLGGAAWGQYVDSALLLIFGGIPWQVYKITHTAALNSNFMLLAHLINYKTM